MAKKAEQIPGSCGVGRVDIAPHGITTAVFTKDGTRIGDAVESDVPLHVVNDGGSAITGTILANAVTAVFQNGDANIVYILRTNPSFNSTLALGTISDTTEVALRASNGQFLIAFSATGGIPKHLFTDVGDYTPEFSVLLKEKNPVAVPAPSVDQGRLYAVDGYPPGGPLSDILWMSSDGTSANLSQSVYGTLLVEDNTDPTNTVLNTPIKIDKFTRYGVFETTQNTLVQQYLVPVVSGDFFVFAHGNVEFPAGIIGQTYEFCITRNNNTEKLDGGCSEYIKTAGIATTETINIQTFSTLRGDDTVELWVTNLSASTPIVIKDMTLGVRKLSNR